MGIRHQVALICKNKDNVKIVKKVKNIEAKCNSFEYINRAAQKKIFYI
jgi:hypothetical protein